MQQTWSKNICDSHTLKLNTFKSRAECFNNLPAPDIVLYHLFGPSLPVCEPESTTTHAF